MPGLNGRKVPYDGTRTVRHWSQVDNWKRREGEDITNCEPKSRRIKGEVNHWKRTAHVRELLMCSIPKLQISRELEEPGYFNPDWTYAFRYRAKHHQDLPHVVKFCGGRSSGMLLFTLLENGILNPERGDVVVFNNTSCEHPETYKFAAKCKSLV